MQDTWKTYWQRLVLEDCGFDLAKVEAKLKEYKGGGIAKALDVSIKSLFEDPVAIEGFVSVGGKVQRFNSVKEFDGIVNGPRTKMSFTLTSTEKDV